MVVLKPNTYAHQRLMGLNRFTLIVTVISDMLC